MTRIEVIKKDILVNLWSLTKLNEERIHVETQTFRIKGFVSIVVVEWF